VFRFSPSGWLVVSATLTAAVTVVMSTPSTGSSSAAEPPWSYVESACPMPIPDTVTIEVTCGFLTVPENRDDPTSDTIRLAVAYLHSPAPDARPDPVVELAGGPGFSSLDGVEGWSTSSILEHRDLILFDQRGLGFSEPNLDCPETNEAVWQVFATNDAPSADGEVMRASLDRCRSRLVAAGVDLDGYDTIQTAADVADLRLALGVDEWNLRGVSYGSAIAQAVLRYHPEGVRSVLLDSVVPADTAFSGVERGEGALRAIGALADACAASASCTESFGDLRTLIADAAAALDAAPYEVAIADHDTGADRTVSIDGGDFYAGVFDLMYDAELLPVIPVAAQAIAGGDNSLIDAYASEGVAFLADQHEAMTFSVDCADRQALMDTAAVEPFFTAHPEMEWLVQLGAHELICPAWGVESNPAPFNELLTATEVDVPVLVMAGAFDPVTPPDGSRRVAEALGLELVLLPNAGHGAVGLDCGRAIWFAFLDDPTAPPDTSCVAEQAPPFA
jgi:pimeloyl-ACP methyl ester carboxylesterase